MTLKPWGEAPRSGYAKPLVANVEVLMDDEFRANRRHCRNSRRAALRIAVALGINSFSASQGNSIVPLYLPPCSVSVSSSRV